MEREKIIMVDENDTIIGSKYRDEVDYTKDIYRVSCVWIKNKEGQHLIGQRGFQLAKDPGKWGAAVAGTIGVGETYEENAVKELQEELGISNVVLTLSVKQYSDSPRKQFIQWFLCEIDKTIEEIEIKKDEVEQLKWVTTDELIADIKNNPDKYVPFMPKTVELLIEK